MNHDDNRAHLALAISVPLVLAGSLCWVSGCTESTSPSPAGQPDGQDAGADGGGPPDGGGESVDADADADGYGAGDGCSGPDCGDEDGSCSTGSGCPPTSVDVPGGPEGSAPVVGCELAERPARRDPSAVETCEAVGSARCWYVSPEGREEAAGTFDDPFGHPQDAVWLAGPGDVIYLRGGVYTDANAHDTGPKDWSDPDAGMNRAFLSLHRIVLPAWAGGGDHRVPIGTADSPITIRSFPGERACATGAGDIDVGSGGPSQEVAYWAIEHITLHRAVIIVGGGAKGSDGQPIDQIHHIDIRFNEIFDYSNTGPHNVGLVKVNRGSWGGPDEILIESNILHDVIPIDPDGETRDWETTQDVQHFGAVSTLSCERYVDPECVGNGSLTIRNNHIYHVPQMVFLKNPAKGPILIENNVAHDIRTLGNWTSSNVTFSGNLAFRAGHANVGGTQGLIDERNGHHFVCTNNTLVGFDQVVVFRNYASGHEITGNVIAGLSLTVADGDWNHTGYVSQNVSGAIPDAATTLADSQLAQNNTFDDNCFVTDQADFLAFSRKYEVGSDVQMNFMGFQQAQSVLGQELQSTVVADRDDVFVDFEAGDYRLVDGGGPCAARGAAVPRWWSDAQGG